MNEKEYVTELLSREPVANEIRKNLDALLRILPQLRDMIGFDHCHPHHHLDVWKHTLLALNHSENNVKTRIALLLHDVGKPHSYQCDGAVRHYRGHAEKSAETAERVLTRLGFDADFTQSVCTIIRRHDLPLSEEDILRAPALSREIFEVQRCDALAHNPAYNQKRLAYVERMQALLYSLSSKP